jgi:cytochrome c-type biogenesis protein CcmH
MLALWLAGSALAVIETYEFSSADLEARYHRLSQELRCPKCQNQNIADSNAPISEDLRRLLYEQLEGGATDQEILDTMVSRYGEFVRYRPSAEGVALWLWLAPVALLGAGVVFLVALLRRGRGETATLDAAERARLAALLGDAPPGADDSGAEDRSR